MAQEVDGGLADTMFPRDNLSISQPAAVPDNNKLLHLFGTVVSTVLYVRAFSQNFKALNGLLCGDVPLRNYTLTVLCGPHWKNCVSCNDWLH